MNIGIIVSVNNNSGGIYQYTISILKALQQRAAMDNFVIFTYPESSIPFKDFLSSRWRIETLPPYILTNQRDIDPFIDANNIDLIRPGFNNRAKKYFIDHHIDLVIYPAPMCLSFECGIPYIMAIHDLQHQLQPEFPEVSAEGQWQCREYLFRNGARFAQAIVVDSVIGKEDVLAFYNTYIAPESIFPLPILPSYLPDQHNISETQKKIIRNKYQLPEQYLFYPAQFWLHKNHSRLIHAIQLLRVKHQLNTPLVLVGSNAKQPQLEAREFVFNNVMLLAKQLGVEDLVHYLGYVPDEDIPALYSMARAMTMPTFFGPTNIPFTEAWSFDCPILAADIRGIREQVQGAGVLVDPKDASSIANGIINLWTNEELRKSLIIKGHAQLSSYKPTDFAKMLYNIIDYACDTLPVKLSSKKIIKPRPLVSAIVSTYNAERFIAGCLSDLENQTIADQLEIIVIDSNSQQKERGIVEEFQKSYNNIIYIRTKEREGLYAAWNRAIKIARGKYITNANTDDRHHPDAFKRLAQALDVHNEVGLVYSDSLITQTENATWEDPQPTGILRFPDYDLLTLFDAPSMGPHPMWRKYLHEKYGYFNEELTIAGDYDFWLRLGVAGIKMLHIAEPLGLYLEIPTSISLKDPGLSWQEAERVRNQHWPPQWGTRPPCSGQWFAQALDEDIIRSLSAESKPKAEPLPVLPPTGKLNILLITHGFPPESMAGTEIYTYNLAKELNQRGHLVRILYPVNEDTLPEGGISETSYNGLAVTQINLHPLQNTPQDLIRDFKNDTVSEKLGNYLNNLKLELVHIQHLSRGLSGSVIEACTKKGLPVIMTLHDSWLFCQQCHLLRFGRSFCQSGPETVDKCVQCFHSRHPNLAIPELQPHLLTIFEMRRRYLKKVLHSIDTLIVPSQFLEQTLASADYQHPHIVRSPLGLKPFDPKPWQVDDSLVRFSYLGNINHTKGLDILINAFNLVDAAKARLDLYGRIESQEYFTQVMGKINNTHTVEYHGAYQPEDLPDILALTDIAVIPSRSENFPTVIRECLHSGVPVIAPDVGGVPEIIQDGENGLLFKPEDCRELANKLSFFINDPKQVKLFRQNIKPVKSISEDVIQLESIYQNTLAYKAKTTDEVINDISLSNNKKDKKIKIGFISQDSPYAACPYLRLKTPLEILSQQRVIEYLPLTGQGNLDNLPDVLIIDKLHKADIIIVQRDAVSLPYNRLMEMCKPNLPKIIFDFDDALMHLPTGHPDYQHWLLREQNLEEYIRKADVVTVSTPALKLLYQHMNSNVVVLPNYIDVRDWHHTQKIVDSKDSKVRILCSGTPSHMDDLFLIEEVLEKIINKFPEKVEIYFWGYSSDQFQKYPQVKYISEYLRDYREYANLLQGLSIDIGIVPLKNNELNRCKSNIKWIEYSICNIAGIYSNLAPYNTTIENGKTGILVNDDTKEWYNALCELIINNDKRRKIAERAKKQVDENYTLQTRAKDYLRVYIQTIAHVAHDLVDEDILNQYESTALKFKASIIVPVFNKLDYTRNCLKTLIRNTPGELYEVIIVDNASTDGTKEFLQTLGGDVKIFTNPENLGFARACNQGADVAEGEFLVFLNNDTEVQPGWLSHGINRLENDLDIGIVGIKLLYPDRTIQHCGIEFVKKNVGPYYIWPEHRLRFAPENDPHANIPGEVDAVTGACLFIRKDFFNQIGKFSIDYGMYFEDTDLCFKARQHGKKIFYEPRSVVIHHEAKSSPRQEVAHTLNEKARKIFYQKWAHEVAEIGLSSYIEKIDGNFVYLNEKIWPQTFSQEELVSFAILLLSLPPFYLHIGGAGDALLLLNTFYDDQPHSTILSMSTSPQLMASLFKAFPLLKRIYFIPHKGRVHALLRSLKSQLPNCLGMGITPVADYDAEWNESLNIFEKYKINSNSLWPKKFKAEKHENFQVVLAPKGSTLFHSRSKRNIINPRFWQHILIFLASKNIKPIIIGTPEEKNAYPANNCWDQRSYSVEEQMQLIASSDLLIAADSWHKTFAALASVPSIVFQSITGPDLQEGWKDSSEYVFTDPWESISLVKDLEEFAQAFQEVTTTGRFATRRVNPPAGSQPRLLTSFDPCFWERDYRQAQSILIRCTPAIGDALYLTAIVAEIKRQYPHLSVYIAGDARVEWVFRHHPGINALVPLGSNEELLIEGKTDFTIEYNHVLDRMLDYHKRLEFFDIFANIAGIKLLHRDLIYSVEPQETAWADDESKKFAYPGLKIGLHFYTDKDIKRSYPHGRNLLNLLHRQYPEAQFILFGTDPLVDSPLPYLFDCVIQQIPFRRQVAMAFHCDAFITIDSAFFHIGHNLCRKPTLLIAGLTNPRLIGNPSAGFVPVQNTHLDCLPCYWQKKCKIECMQDLQPEVIVKSFAAMISNPASACFNWQQPLPQKTLYLPDDGKYKEAIMQALIDNAGPIELVLRDPHHTLPPWASQWNGITIDGVPNLRKNLPEKKDNFEISLPKYNIVWEGPQFIYHSMAHVNRELCLQLITRGHNLSIISNDPGKIDHGTDQRFAPLADRIGAKLAGPAEIHVRHWYPPDLTPPAEGHWVMIQPWEMGSIPKQWIEVMGSLLDELWVPSSFVRDCYLKSGLPYDRVFVVPNGINVDQFNPQARPIKIPTQKSFKFLYVGATTLERKGFDILLNGYLSKFRRSDDVCLVIKDMAIYTGGRNPLAEQIKTLQAQPGAPEIIFWGEDLPPDKMAGLYTACNCLVHPYRGEGFGLPIAEAMACGLPVIVPGYGACLDFCNEENAYLIPVKEVRLHKVYSLETVDYPWWCEADVDALVRTMRQVMEDPQAATAKGRAACDYIRKNFTWERAAATMEERLAFLRRQPIRRFTNLAAVPKPVALPARQAVKFQVPPVPSPSLPQETQPTQKREGKAAMRGGVAQKSRVLVIAPVLPTFDRDSGSFRLFQILRLLRQAGHEVTFIAQAGAGGIDPQPYLEALRELGISVFPHDPEKLFERAGVRLNLPDLNLQGILTQHHYDTAYLYKYFIALQYMDEIRNWSPQTCIMVDSVDLNFLREERMLEVTKNQILPEEVRRHKENELWVYEQADVVVTITEFEKEKLLQILPHLPVDVLPNIHPLTENTRSFRDRQDLLFVGGFLHNPNIDAMEYFCRNVWPLIAARLPEVKLYIVGDRPPASVQGLANERIVVTGFVPDTKPFLESCRISLAPLRFGAGMKGKVGEALAAGLPVVGTSIAFEGMSLQSGKHVLECDDDQAFATAVVKLYQDEALWNRLSQEGKQFIDKHYSFAAVADRLERLFAHWPKKKAQINSAVDQGRDTTYAYKNEGKVKAHFQDRNSLAVQQLRLAQECKKIKSYEEAIGHLEKAKALLTKPKQVIDPEAIRHFKSGKRLKEQKEFGQAIEEFSRAKEILCKHPEMVDNLPQKPGGDQEALHHFQLGKEFKGQKDFNRAIEQFSLAKGIIRQEQSYNRSMQ